jgi:hypothetical protein
VFPTSSPSAGVSLCTPEGTGGCNRKASLITASRYGNLERDM